MSIQAFYITDGSQDYQTGDNANSTATSMSARVINTVSPGISSQAVAEITVSGLPAGSVINGVKLTWYTVDYTKSRSTTYNQRIQIWDGSNYANIWSDDPASEPSGGAFYDLSAAQIASYFNANGVNRFRFLVSDPGGAESRDWEIGTYEAGLAFAVSLVVDYTVPSGVRTQVVFL